MTRKKILVADLLCGAGGSSTGCARALRNLGLEMELVCVNHWPTALDTHSLNHPEARHYCQDIATVRPHLIVPEGYLDLLMASPSCTHHSVARGGKPTSDQQRSDPWHIVTWLTELRVKRIIIENVWEFVQWGPVDHRTGKPIKARKGEYFRAWIETIRRLGFDPEWRKLNAADFGDATTRQRFILMARSDGRTVSWPVPTHRKRDDGGLALFPGVKPWRPAREIIDWSIKGRSIFSRKKPLAPKTLARIYAGAIKFQWPEPFLVILRNHMAGQSVDDPVPTIAANGLHTGLAQPVILSQHNSGAPRSADDPLPTITTGGAGTQIHPGCARPMLAEPVIVNGRKGNKAKGVDHEPVPTLDTKGGVWLAEPFILPQDARGATRPPADTLPTILGGGAHALIAPYYSSGSGETCSSADMEPIPTVTTKARLGMVVPVTQSNGGPGPRDTAQPLPTMTTAKGGEFAIVEPTPECDILFRMLEPHELAAAMGFSDDEARYEFAGTKTDQIKQIGNAVSVAKMKACVGAIMADAEPKRKSAAPAAESEAA